MEDGEKVSSDASSGIIITKKIETTMLISMLVIRSSRMSDAGIYVCRSSNRDAAMINVIVINGQLHTLIDVSTKLQKVSSLKMFRGLACLEWTVFLRLKFSRKPLGLLPTPLDGDDSPVVYHTWCIQIPLMFNLCSLSYGKDTHRQESRLEVRKKEVPVWNSPLYFLPSLSVNSIPLLFPFLPSLHSPSFFLPFPPLPSFISLRIPIPFLPSASLPPLAITSPGLSPLKSSYRVCKISKRPAGPGGARPPNGFWCIFS